METRKDGDRRSARIGVIDSGIGGMTVVRELAGLLPGADIIYFGDSANVPYGNRSEPEIVSLTCAMLDFMAARQVAVVAIACNTISTLVDRFRSRYDFPILSIIEPAAARVADSNLAHVGLVATEFTVRTGAYQRLIARGNPSTQVHTLGSPSLASLIEAQENDDEAIDAEVGRLLSCIFEAYPVRDIILGCTHYPIVLDSFRKHAPEVNFIDPALLQAREVQRLLEDRGIAPGPGPGDLDISTSGGAAGFERILGKLRIDRPCRIHAQR
jgi:glutamate racemase